MDDEDDAVLRVVTLLPDLLGTYGDGGNATVLVERARRRGIAAEQVAVTYDDDVVEGSIYLLGGGEDGPQRLACDLLARSSFAQRVRDGAHVLAVCAGLQILGQSFSIEGNDSYEGLGLFDVVTTRGQKRSVGDLSVQVGERLLVGFENHGGHTTLGANVAPLGKVVRGKGNDAHVDGFRSATTWATYAHGPVLALNPWLADELLSSVLDEELSPLSSVADQLYEQRCRVLARS
jgi:hypothetical protein